MPHNLRVWDACLCPIFAATATREGHIARVVSKCGSQRGCRSAAYVPLRFFGKSCPRCDTCGSHAGWLQRLHTLNEKGKKVTETILPKVCAYPVDNAKGQVCHWRTLGTVRIRLAKLKKGCFWGFVATEDEKEEERRRRRGVNWQSRRRTIGRRG